MKAVNMIRLKSLGVALTLIISSSQAFADQGGSASTRGGGDEVGLEAQRLALEAVHDLRGMSKGSHLGATSISTGSRQPRRAATSWRWTAPCRLKRTASCKTRSRLTIRSPRACRSSARVGHKSLTCESNKATALHETLSLMGGSSPQAIIRSPRYLNLLGYPCNQVLCNGAPVPVESGLTWESATQAFVQQGQAPQAMDLEGQWKLIGRTEVPSAVSGDLFGFGIPQGFDPNGLTNPDGSLQTLLFQTQTDFFGNSSQIVGLAGLGSAAVIQGPFAVSFLATGACFAQHVYDGRTRSFSDSAHFNNECRLVKNRTALLCAMTFNGLIPAADLQYRPYDGQIVSYGLYIR